MRYAVLLVLLLAAVGAVHGDVLEVPSAYPTIQAAVTAAAPGDTVSIAAGTYAVTSTIAVNKAITISGATGALVTTSGLTSNVFSITAAGATLEGLEIQKIGKSPSQNLIYIGASDVTIRDNVIHGQFAIGDSDTTRAMEIAGGLSGLLITGNTIYSLRQPAYINKSTGTISNNYVYATKGWVVSDGSNMAFTGNSWGQGVQANAVDIAIIVDSPPASAGYSYQDIAGMMAANNNARIDDQRSGSACMAKYVSTTGSDSNTGRVESPYATIRKAITEIAEGGSVIVAAGTYVEELSISKNLTLYGAGSGTVIQSPVTLTNAFTTSAANRPVILVHYASSVYIRNLVLDGAGMGNSNYRFMGIAYFNAGGGVYDCEIENVRDTPFSGAQHGVGVGAYSTLSFPLSFAVQGCSFHDIQKSCLVVSGAGLTADISDNTFIGVGHTSVTAQNGVQISPGVAGQVVDNYVSGFYYTGPSWAATAIMNWGGENITISGNTVTLSNLGVYIETTTGTVVTGNNLAGNDWGIDNESAGVVDARGNWWGEPDGSQPGGSGDYVWDSYAPALDVSDPLAKAAGPNVMYLEPTIASVCIKPTETAVVNLNVANLQQPVNGLQAMLNFSSTYFGTGGSAVNVAPGGGDWDELIYNVWNTGGDLDVAVGVKLTLSAGTQADATTAVITLTPTGTEGYTQVVFRPDLDPDPGLIGTTMLTDLVGGVIMPAKVNSTNIFIDGTAPTVTSFSASPLCTKTATALTFDVTDDNCGVDYVDVLVDSTVVAHDVSTDYILDLSGSAYPTGTYEVKIRVYDKAGNWVDSTPVSVGVDKTAPTIASITATQGGSSVLCPSLAVQGVVDIYVTVTDTGCSGLVVPPTVDVAGMTATYVDASGDTYHYQVTVDAATANGSHMITVTAKDNLDNTTVDSTKSLCVDKNQVLGTVSFSTLSNTAYSVSRDVVFVATDSSETVLKTWTVSVAFTNAAQTASGSFRLNNVPAAMARLSAKMAWTLRKRVGATLNGDGQASASIELLGGDINGSNSINVLDYSIMKTSWGSGTTGDVNGDGFTGTLDYSIMKSNWFKLGDAQ